MRPPWLPQQTTEYLDGDMVDQGLRGSTATWVRPGCCRTRTCRCATSLTAAAICATISSSAAFGNVIAQTQYNGLGGATPETPQTDTWTGLFTFAGMQRDPATGLYYDNARYYSPSLQRFISPDPLGLSGGGTNLFAYTDNAPTDATDPERDVKDLHHSAKHRIGGRHWFLGAHEPVVRFRWD